MNPPIKDDAQYLRQSDKIVRRTSSDTKAYDENPSGIREMGFPCKLFVAGPMAPSAITPANEGLTDCPLFEHNPEGPFARLLASLTDEQQPHEESHPGSNEESCSESDDESRRGNRHGQAEPGADAVRGPQVVSPEHQDRSVPVHQRIRHPAGGGQRLLRHSRGVRIMCVFVDVFKGWYEAYQRPMQQVHHLN